MTMMNLTLLLGRAVRGGTSENVLYILLGYQMLGKIDVLLPLAFYLGVLLTLSRWRWVWWSWRRRFTPRRWRCARSKRSKPKAPIAPNPIRWRPGSSPSHRARGGFFTPKKSGGTASWKGFSSAVWKRAGGVCWWRNPATRSPTPEPVTSLWR